MAEETINPLEATFVALDMITSTMFTLHHRSDIKAIRDYIFSIEVIIGFNNAAKLYELLNEIELRV